MGAAAPLGGGLRTCDPGASGGFTVCPLAVDTGKLVGTESIRQTDPQSILTALEPLWLQFAPETQQQSCLEVTCSVEAGKWLKRPPSPHILFHQNDGR